MLSEKLANDIAEAALSKMQTKTAGLGRKLLGLGALGAGVGAYAYAPELITASDDYLNQNENFLNKIKRRGIEATLAGQNAAANAAAYIPYKANALALDMAHASDPNFDTLNYYGDKLVNRAQYEKDRFLNGANYRGMLAGEALSRNFPQYFGPGE